MLLLGIMMLIVEDALFYFAINFSTQNTQDWKDVIHQIDGEIMRVWEGTKALKVM